uniref:Uncharacterized protein n=1 Tax=viral metagenome TaxID=1070528 RepID=A0A6M3KTB2_9ZZZZ
MNEQDWLQETIKTVNNLCLISFILIDADRRELLPTVIELMHLETQDLINDYCVINSCQTT